MEQQLKEVLGYSDYSRLEIFTGRSTGAIGNTMDIMSSVHEFERCGWTVVFKTSLFRRIFLMAKYKIVATKVVCND